MAMVPDEPGRATADPEPGEVGRSESGPVGGPSLTLDDQVADDADVLRRIEAKVRHNLFTKPTALRIGRYTVLERIGSGGMGTVYAAYDEQLDRKVALKVLLEEDLRSERHRLRFQREALALARMSHPNVVTVHEVGEEDGELFLAMEFIRGESVSEWLETDPDWREVLETFIEAGRGLAAAHEAGLVHRDLKPHNIMRSHDGVAKVVDFGLARSAGEELEEEEEDVVESLSTTGSSLASSLTHTGALVGTPAYMSPEQHRGEPTDARSDQYGYCVALWQSLTGWLPFEVKVSEMMALKLQGPPSWPNNAPPVPRGVVEALRRGMSPFPTDRWPTMHELLDVLADDPAARRRRFALTIGLGLTLVAGTVGMLSLSGEVTELSDEVTERDAVIEEQADELELKNAELEEQLAVQTRLLSAQRGLRASALVGTGSEAEALLMGVLAVGAHADAWSEAPPEAIEGLEQVLAHDTVNLEASLVLEGHEDYVTDVAFSPDGGRLASVSNDGTARIWDPASARQLAVLDLQTPGADAIAFSADGARLATVSVDGRARLWNVDTGHLLATLEGHRARLVLLRFSPDGTRLATAGFEPTVRLWDVRTGALVTSMSSGEGQIFDLDLSPDGSRLVSAGSDGRARVWDANTGKRLAVHVGHERAIHAVAISPDGTRAVTGDEAGAVRMWALGTGELVAALEGHEWVVNDLAYSPDGTRLTTGSFDATGRVYDARTGESVATLAGAHGFGLVRVAYSPDGSRVATCGFDGAVGIWDPETGELRMRLRGHKADVWGMSFSPDGRWLATASVDRSVRLWDIGSGDVVVLEGPESDVRVFATSPDHERLATVSTGGAVSLWATRTGELERTLDDDGGDGLATIVFSPDGSQLAVGRPGRLELWDPRTGESILDFDVPERDRAPSIGYSRTGSMRWQSSLGALRIYDTRSHELLATIEHEHKYLSFALLPDDTRLFVAVSLPVVDVYDPRTGERIDELRLPAERIRGMSSTPDGSTLAIVVEGHGLLRWDARDLVPLPELEDAADVTSHVLYSPDGAYLAALVGRAEQVRIWDARTGRVLTRIESSALDPRTQGLRFSPDGRRLAVHGVGLLRIHDVATGELVTQVGGRGSIVRSFVFSPDGRRITSSTTDNVLEIWDVQTGESLTRERVGVVREGGSIEWPSPPVELMRIGCARLRVFEHTYPGAEDVCEPLLGG